MDDEQDDLDLQRRAFATCKVLNDVIKLKGGAAAVAYLRESKLSGHKRFLIFVDLMMRPEDGLWVMRRIKEEALAEGSVIVMLSGLTDVKLLHEGYQLGACTFLVKPLKVQDVMGLLATLRHSVGVLEGGGGNRLVWK
ncbi:MAG TPA: response regulator [Chthoniobacteraceae bacterium]|nr:response regulator [Chthoniobacteraceae bacterium]